MPNQFVKLSVIEEGERRKAMDNRPYHRARLSELWYMRVRYAIRYGKNGEHKLAIYKRLFPECLNFIQALEGFMEAKTE